MIRKHNKCGSKLISIDGGYSEVNNHTFLIHKFCILEIFDIIYGHKHTYTYTEIVLFHSLTVIKHPRLIGMAQSRFETIFCASEIKHKYLF